MPRHADIGGALIESFGPELFIRQPVRADNAQSRELLMQAFHFTGSRRFNVQHQNVSVLLRDRGANFL
jgi:hypothetical protein